MLPYSAVAAIDYAAYQSRPHGMSSSTNNIGMPVGAAAAAAAFTHSWFVPSSGSENEEIFYAVDNNSNKIQYQKDIVDPGHVIILLFYFMVLVISFKKYLTLNLNKNKKFLILFLPLNHTEGNHINFWTFSNPLGAILKRFFQTNPDGQCRYGHLS